MKATWFGKKTCYTQYKPTFSGWRVAVGVTTLFSKCGSWEAHVTINDGGLPIPFTNSGQRVEAGVLIQKITKERQIFGVKFSYPGGPPDCIKASISVKLVGVPDDDDSEPHECCTELPAKSESGGKWPPYCGSACTEPEEVE